MVVVLLHHYIWCDVVGMFGIVWLLFYCTIIFGVMLLVCLALFGPSSTSVCNHLPSPAFAITFFHHRVESPSSTIVWNHLPPPSCGISFLHHHVESPSSIIMWNLLPPPSCGITFLHHHVESPSSKCCVFCKEA